MKILDYKLISKRKTISYGTLVEHYLPGFYKEFEKCVNEHIETGYTPIGGIETTYIEGDHILTQTMVLYEN